ncbi:uncharacterized protein LOC135487042 [Lineus longissimus]|uniref:uncharacterized protein LOC135487042 n=1 Tax=Lineus longissimus TaxID=88925 RepID=UPI00315D658A
MAAPTISGHSAGNTTTATNNTVNSSIAIAYGNQKTHNKLEAWNFGPGKRPFKYGIATAICATVVIVAGFAVLGLRFDGRILIGSWEGEFIAPCIIVCGILLYGLSVKFFLVARKKSNEERKKIAFRPEGLTHVSTVNVAFEPDRSSKNKYRYDMRSGTTSVKAVRSLNQSTYSGDGTLDSRNSRDSRDARSPRGKPMKATGSLPSLDRTRTTSWNTGSLPSLDPRHPTSTPNKSNLATRTPDSVKGPPKPRRSLVGSASEISDGQPQKAPIAADDDDDDEVCELKVRSESEFSNIPL